MTLLADMVAGADSIEDTDRLRRANIRLGASPRWDCPRKTCARLNWCTQCT